MADDTYSVWRASLLPMKTPKHQSPFHQPFESYWRSTVFSTIFAGLLPQSLAELSA